MITKTAPPVNYCPECKGPAILHTAGDREEGYVECINFFGECGYYDLHDHEQAIEDGLAEREVEDGVEDYYDPGDYYGHGQREFRYYVCGGEQGCGVQLDGDPDQDAADDRADMAYDEWRDNQL